MIEGTCLKEKCYIWKKEGDKCPFFLQTLWRPEKGSEAKTLEDCAPRRNTILLMEYSSRAIGLQKDYEDQRNKYDQLIKDMSTIIIALDKQNKDKKLTDKSNESKNLIR